LPIALRYLTRLQTLLPLGDASLHRRRVGRSLSRGDAAQYIDRIFSGTSNVQQQETSYDTESVVRAVHAVNPIRTCHSPIAMTNKRSSQRV
jgi:hypothetical protein